MSIHSDTKTHAYLMLADGFEEIEALIPIDFLRRAEVSITTVAVTKTSDLLVKGSHGVSIQADCLLSNIAHTIAKKEKNIIILPGGMPGAVNLAQNVHLQNTLIKHNNNTGTIAAICAAPIKVLAPLGILKNKKFTCYPAAKKDATVDGVFIDSPLVEDGNLITSQGVATAPLFAKRIIEILANKKVAATVWQDMLYPLHNA